MRGARSGPFICAGSLSHSSDSMDIASSRSGDGSPAGLGQRSLEATLQARHVPAIDSRYWAGIFLASVFGTNLGDLYAHESGLGLLGGLPILVALFLLAYVAERFDRTTHDAYYWICITIMRTGATNIADYVHFRMHINGVALSLALGALLALLGPRSPAAAADGPKTLPQSGARYWGAMLTAGVFGTVLGDVLMHRLGPGIACPALGGLMALVLVLRWRGATALAGYWLTIAVARTAGTAFGDALADNRTLHLGLPLCTLITGAALLAVLVLWPRRPPLRPQEAEAYV
jgi:uncharacterized membrane-anchored protein